MQSHPITGLDRSTGFREFEAPKMYTQSAHEGGRVVSPTHRPPLLHRPSRSQGHSGAKRVQSMKNLTHPIGNRTRDHPACREVPRPTEPPRTSHFGKQEKRNRNNCAQNTRYHCRKLCRPCDQVPGICPSLVTVTLVYVHKNW